MAALTAFVLTSCAAQVSDRRWRLLPDSMVLAPYEELRMGAAFRRYQDEKVRSLAWKAAKINQISLEKDTLIRDKDLEISALRDADTAGDMALTELSKERDTWRKAARRTKAEQWWKLPLVGLVGFFIGKELSQ